MPNFWGLAVAITQPSLHQTQALLRQYFITINYVQIVPHSCFVVIPGDLEYILVDKNIKAENLLKDEEITVKLLIIVEEPTEDVKTLAQGRGIELMTFAQLEELGKENLKDFVVSNDFIEITNSTNAKIKSY